MNLLTKYTKLFFKMAPIPNLNSYIEEPQGYRPPQWHAVLAIFLESNRNQKAFHCHFICFPVHWLNGTSFPTFIPHSDSVFYEMNILLLVCLLSCRCWFVLLISISIFCGVKPCKYLFSAGGLSFYFLCSVFWRTLLSFTLCK